ncbi:myosin-2 heavy chain-like isoform X1 [Selaginella moellendorffii]|uniref:myosin-2 heavy chain-like isoform X1 n=1 Tax=Selaginella moellendorffii TaxID=88036 RepID=UPI000D1D0865|nr:myosin-2 heavy chain-like isoform X1 [Selaginella moellendorffii]|eukprot:XP_024536132.1 myosin-2 heavy chain-like isoform X1 [Selaginella moellendorffii]
MLKFKKNPGGKIKEKVVFKFQFHVTRVPPAGWEKLKVSLIPQDTGKRSNKTTKAAVEYGCCRWPDPLVETTKLIQDAQSGKYDSKLYKIVVGVRTKILGDVTINLADFANGPSNSLAVPLQNCRGNTLLHVKINSLTSLRKSRELSVQDEQSSDSEVDVDNISVASSTSQALSGPVQKSVSSPRDNGSSLRDTDLEPFTPREFNGSVKEFFGDPPSPASSVGGYERRRRRFSQGSFPTISLEPQLGRTGSGSGMRNIESLSNMDSDTPRSIMSVRSSSFRSKSPIEAEAPAPDKSIQELRMEAVTWQRRARNLSMEVQKLKQENGGGPKQLLADKLKLELQTAKQEHEANEQRLRKEAEELARSISDLKMELSYEKEASLNASMQLRKAQESNMQLVLAIQDMEESLEEQRKEMEELSSLNHNLEASVHAAKTREENRESQWSEKLVAKENTIKGLQAKLEDLRKSRSEIKRELATDDEVSQSTEEMAKELKELTDENMELIFKLNKATKEFDKQNNDDRQEVERLKALVDELEKKLAATEEFHQVQHSSNEKLMVRLQTLIQGLKSANVDLENQLRSSDADIQSLNNQLERAKSELTLAGQEQERLTRLVEEASTGKAQLESEVSALMFRAQKHDREMSDLLHDFNSKLLQVTDLEARILQLEMLNNGLEMKMQDSQELDKSRILDLELQVSTLASSLEAADAHRKELEEKVVGLEVENDGWNRSFEESTRKEAEKLSSQLDSAKMEFDRHVAELEDDLEKARQDLEAQLSRSKKENVEVNETVTRKDAEVQFLVSELEALKLQLSAEQGRGREIEKQKAVLAATMNEYKSKWITSDTLCETHSRARRDLEAQVERLKAELSKASTSSHSLRCRIRELEESLSELTAEHLKTTQNMEEESKLVAKKISSLEAERESLKLELEVSQTEKVVLEREAVHIAKEKTALETTKNCLELTCSELNMKVGKLEEDREAHRLAEEKLELQVKDLTDTLRSLENTLGMRESCIKELEGTLKVTESNHNEAVKKLARDVAGLEEDNVKHVKEISMLQEHLSTLTSELKRCELDAESRDARSRGEMLELEEKVVLLENEREALKQDGRNLHMHIGVLKGDIAMRVGTQGLLERRAKELEDQICSTVEILKECQREKAAAEDHNRELEAAVEKWERTGQELEGTIAKLEGERDAQGLALKDLELQVKSLKSTVSSLENSGHVRENRVRELEDTLSITEQSEKRLTEKLEEDHVKHAEEVSSLQEDVRALTRELESCKCYAEETQLLNSQEKSRLEEKVLQVENERDDLQQDARNLEAQVEALKNDIIVHLGTQELLQHSLQGKLEELLGLESKVLVLESDCNLLKNDRDGLEMQVADFKHQALDSAVLNGVLQDQVAELTATLSSIGRERDALMESWNAEKNKAIHAEQRLETFVQDREKLEWFLQQTETIARQMSQVEAGGLSLEATLEEARQKNSQLDHNIEKQEIEAKDIGCKVEQSVATLFKLASQMENEMEDMRVANRDCASKLGKCEQEVLALKVENDAYKPEIVDLKTTLLNLKQDKLALEARIQDLEAEKLRLQCQVQVQHLQGHTESEKLDFISARLQALRSNLDKVSERNVLQKIEELKREYKQEEADVHDKLILLEVQLSCKMNEIEALKQEHQEKDATLQTRVDYLETTMGRQMDAGLEQFQVEVARLQTQLALCAQRERDLVSKLSMQEISEKEVCRLQQVGELQGLSSY